MRKIFLFVGLLSVVNVFAAEQGSICSKIVFQGNSAYIKGEEVPAIKVLCTEYYDKFSAACDMVEFRDDGSAWILAGDVPTVYAICTNKVAETRTPEEEDSFFFRLFKDFAANASKAHWRR